MTPKSKQALDVIRALTVDGVSPTLDEIASALGLTGKSGVHRMLGQLEREGLIVRDRYAARSIRIVEGPTREQMEIWSDAEIVRVANLAIEIHFQRFGVRLGRAVETAVAHLNARGAA